MLRALSLLALLSLVVATASPQDILGKKGGGGSDPKGGSGSGSAAGKPDSRPKPPPPPQRNPPRQSDPPAKKSDPPRQNPRADSPPQGAPNRGEPPQRVETVERPAPSSGSVTGKVVSRTGSARYGTVNNQTPREPAEIVAAPALGSNGRIVREVRQEDRVAVGQDRSRRSASSTFRVGYWHYDRNWRDDWFAYPFYSFAYFDDCVPSPLYWYSHLPGYIRYERIVIGPFGWRACTTRYGWRSSQSLLSQAVLDIQSAFLRGDARYIDQLLPRDSRVTVEIDCESRYQLRSDDFYDLMHDVVRTTRTVDYRLTGVWRDWDEATVTALHTFRDAWGRFVTQRHTYGLREWRRGYEIVYFRSRRDGWP